MASFQKTTLILATVILILGLSFIAFLIYNSKSQVWPPAVPQCPDWWKATVDASGNVICKNIQNLGTCSADFNPNDSKYTGDNGPCNKYTWANSCKIMWDGVNYGVSNPCTSN